MTLKMNTFDSENDSPDSSKDSYSGYYRNIKMSYECMIEVRSLERRLRIEQIKNRLLKNQIETDEAYSIMLQETAESLDKEIDRLTNLYRNESRIRQFYVEQTRILKAKMRKLKFIPQRTQRTAY
jgi:hypothetical protein